jgi:hypothetical protein
MSRPSQFPTRTYAAAIVTCVALIGTWVSIETHRAKASTQLVSQVEGGGQGGDSNEGLVAPSSQGMSRQGPSGLRGERQVHWSDTIEQFERDVAIGGLDAWVNSHLLVASGDPDRSKLNTGPHQLGADSIKMELSVGDAPVFSMGQENADPARPFLPQPFQVTVVNPDGVEDTSAVVTCLYVVDRGVDVGAPLVGLWRSSSRIGREREFPCSGAQCLITVETASQKAVWIGVPNPDLGVVVKLGEGKRLAGQVRIEEAVHEFSGGVVTAWCEAMEPISLVASCRVGPSGTWNLPELHGIQATEVTLRHLSRSCVDCEQDVALPRSGEQAFVSLECGTAATQVVVIATTDDAPILDCTVESLWVNSDGDGWIIRREVTGPAGEACFSSVPKEGVYFRVVMDQFAPTMVGPFSLPLPHSAPVVIYPGRAASLKGIVTLDGSAAKDFEIHWWRDRADIDSRAFSGMDRGSFELTSIEEGELWLLARMGEEYMSLPTLVKLIPDQEISVALELELMPLFEGRVIDAESGRPIAGATVAASIPERSWVAEEPEWAETDEEGGFTGVRVPTHSASLVVWKAGFAATELILRQAHHEAGEVTLEMLQANNSGVQVTSESTIDFSAIGLMCPASEVRGRIPFDSDGLALITGVRSEVISGEIIAPWRGVLHFSFKPDDYQGRVASIALDVGRQVTVTVLGEGVLPWVELRYLTPQGVHLVAARRIDEDTRSAIFSEVTGGDLQVAIVEQGRDVHHSVEHVPMNGDWAIQVEPGYGSLTKVLRDDGGGVLREQKIWFYFAQSSDLNRSYRSDGEGRLGIPAGLDPESLMVVVSPVRSLIWWAEMSSLLQSPSPELDVVPVGRIQVQCSSTINPISTATVEFYHPDLEDPLHRVNCNPAGSSEWVKVGSSRFDLVVKCPGYWPRHVEVEELVGDRILPITLRCLGALTIDWRSIPDEGVAATLMLRDQATGHWVRSWCNSGRIQCDLNRRGAAETEVIGIPEGTYDWMLVEDGVTTGEGEALVTPKERTVLAVNRT